MILAIVRWFGRNLGTLLLAFVLALVVWVSAVVTNDPNERSPYPRPIPLDVVGKDPGLIINGEIPDQVRVTIDAPQSVWNRLSSDPSLIKAWIDLSGLGPGKHTVPVKVRVDASPVRSSVEPSTAQLTLEPLISRKFKIQLIIEGEPSPGYQKGIPTVSPQEVTVSGPQSMVERVAEVHATLDISGSRDTRKANISLAPVDSNGDPVNGLTLSPKIATITQPVTLEGGYKNVVVKVVTSGKPATGYRLTNISVTPLNVTVFSANPELVNELPGFVETNPVDLTGLSDDVEVRVGLNLPKEISLVGVQSVLVQVSVAAIEGTLTVSIPVEQLGLPPNLEAHISPATVDAIVSGPLPILDKLKPTSFRAVVDLTGLEPGTYQLTPKTDLVPDQVQVQSILPETVEATLIVAPTPTATLQVTPTTNLPPPSAATPVGAPNP